MSHYLDIHLKLSEQALEMVKTLTSVPVVEMENPVPPYTRRI